MALILWFLFDVIVFNVSNMTDKSLDLEFISYRTRRPAESYRDGPQLVTTGRLYSGQSLMSTV